MQDCLGALQLEIDRGRIRAFGLSNESAWEVGLACGGEIAVYLEQIN